MLGGTSVASLLLLGLDLPLRRPKIPSSAPGTVGDIETCKAQGDSDEARNHDPGQSGSFCTRVTATSA